MMIDTKDCATIALAVLVKLMLIAFTKGICFQKERFDAKFFSNGLQYATLRTFANQVAAVG
jgi:hypothetical protein